jgi:hypothetical protein
MPTVFMFDDTIIAEYIRTSFGYGDYRGKYWFVGMEEGGGGDLEQVGRKLANWDQRGRPELSDLRPYQTGRVQATWGKLIRILLSINGEPIGKQAVLEYQNSRLGRTGGENCVIELMPLPSPNAGAWLYGLHSGLPGLGTRKRYMEQYAEARALHLKKRVEEYAPIAVVFYGINGWNLGWWRFIAGVELKQEMIGPAKYLLGNNARTIFAVAIHPTALVKGVGNKYFEQLGQAVARQASTL